MSSSRTNSWQDIQERIRRNIRDRTWPPGELIPGEARLAEEYGCARTTVNRALRELAATGVVERKRRAGTRVAEQQARRVSAEIPVVRAEVEGQGNEYDFRLLTNKLVTPPKGIREKLILGTRKKALHIRTLHLANDCTYIYEDRWINSHTIPEIMSVDLQTTSVNEWLVCNIPFTHGTFVINSVAADKSVARQLNVEAGMPLLKSERVTWLENRSVTCALLYYAPGYRLTFEI